MIRRSQVLFASLLIATSLLVGCVQYPTERQSVVDQRPQISFRFEDSDAARLGEARVLVDGLDSGRLGDFVDGRGSLRVLPGSHTIRVVNGSVVLLDERVYLGDGVARPFNIR
jgi:hypothetical protein